ncbi:hypothetical protein [Methylobacterium oxalidis]|uniref:Uncharacterized protein n=1 Tax=Methylobacterium oxalidis TaxID=944322 RepID=A0A512J5X4_9HYPH|nr:hypothetical protein [Methylobacterium oxalidis]GEP05302.1 hypothetical protein MOX02_33400 [Methylobacterium oxalidis]GJE30004.1 hypothetical protein LDDCCGHA_0167 [Methylobacterium oxalidis]GLS64654.1 hypothetical protein GCM10007888_30350 [Methylobacterium oxalidis]
MTNIVAHPAAVRSGQRRPRAAAQSAAGAARIPVPLGGGAVPPAPVTVVATACSPELLAAAETAVDGALDAVFALDPLLGPDLSQIASVLASVVKRHGIVLEAALAEVLEQSGRYLVLRGVAMPITHAAQQLLSRKSPEALRDMSIALQGAVAQTVFLDLVVVDLSTRRAILAEVKRGSGKSEMRKRHQVEWVLRAAQLQGRAFLASLGYQVASAQAVLIDVYGRGGFSADLTVTGADLDALFEVPVGAALEAVTTVLAARLRAGVPALGLDAGAAPDRS